LLGCRRNRKWGSDDQVWGKGDAVGCCCYEWVSSPGAVQPCLDSDYFWGPLYVLSCLVAFWCFALFAVSIRVSISVHAMRVQDQQGPVDAGSVGCMGGAMCREVGQAALIGDDA
jgi:hypothetical protein